jgi:hypothetical protein
LSIVALEKKILKDQERCKKKLEKDKQDAIDLVKKEQDKTNR